MREMMPLVIDNALPPVGKPYASTGSLMSGRTAARLIGACVLKNDSSSSLRTAKSIPGATPTTVAEILSPAWLAWICTWLEYRTTCAFVRMRLPSMITPEAVTSLGACFVHGLNGSGYRSVENTLTTAFSTLVGTAGVGSCAAAAYEWDSGARAAAVPRS